MSWQNLRWLTPSGKKDLPRMSCCYSAESSSTQKSLEKGDLVDDVNSVAILFFFLKKVIYYLSLCVCVKERDRDRERQRVTDR